MILYKTTDNHEWCLKSIMTLLMKMNYEILITWGTMALLQQNMLKTQLQSARNSLLFMETEHAKTLKGLHSEIQHLQKKCSGKKCSRIYDFNL